MDGRQPAVMRGIILAGGTGRLLHPIRVGPASSCCPESSSLSLVGHTPTLAGRSALLAVLAFVGAWSVCGVLAKLDQATALLVGSALVALGVTLSAGG